MLESLFKKVAGLKACNFIKKRHQQRRFPVNIVKFLRTHILKNIRETAASTSRLSYKVIFWSVFNFSFPDMTVFSITN